MRRTEPNRLRDQDQWHAGLHVDDMEEGIYYAYCPLHGAYTDIKAPVECSICLERSECSSKQSFSESNGRGSLKLSLNTEALRESQEYM